jgi:hypothetical protein
MKSRDGWSALAGASWPHNLCCLARDQPGAAGRKLGPKVGLPADIPRREQGLERVTAIRWPIRAFTMNRSSRSRWSEIRRLRRIKWNELRHSFTSILTTRGAPLRIVQSLLGRSTIRMKERTRISRRARARATCICSPPSRHRRRLPRGRPRAQRVQIQGGSHTGICLRCGCSQEGADPSSDESEWREWRDWPRDVRVSARKCWGYGLRWPHPFMAWVGGHLSPMGVRTRLGLVDLCSQRLDSDA